MVFAKIFFSNIFKHSIFWYSFVDFLSLIQNHYKYPILAQVKSQKIGFKQTLPRKNSENLKHDNYDNETQSLEIQNFLGVFDHGYHIIT